MEKEKLQLNIRHIAQIVRRNMITRVKPSGKVYSRKINKKIDIFSE
jgi:hypothetical protein